MVDAVENQSLKLSEIQQGSEVSYYLAGVECDGATYHRQATARDRDHLRESILIKLGWRIRRVWSTEWWHSAKEACEKLHQRLTQDLAEDRACTSDRRDQTPELHILENPNNWGGVSARD